MVVESALAIAPSAGSSWLPQTGRSAGGVASSCNDIQSWTRKFEQVDKWSFCLIAAMIAANRRDYEQKTAP
jgi:hypothetical protein